MERWLRRFAVLCQNSALQTLRGGTWAALVLGLQPRGLGISLLDVGIMLGPVPLPVDEILLATWPVAVVANSLYLL